MKRKLFILFIGLLPLCVFSQKDSVNVTPVKNSFMLEVNFNPFGQEGVFSFDNLQTKVLVTENIALRLGVEFDKQSNKVTEDDYHEDVTRKPESTQETLLLGIKPGFEYRIKTNSRITPYLGFELSYKNRKSSEEYNVTHYYYDGYEEEMRTYTETIDGAWIAESMCYYDGMGYYCVTTYENRSFNSFGTNFLIGADLAITKHLYAGFEIGLGYEHIKYKGVEMTSTDPDFETRRTPGYRTSDFGFYYNSAIRLGVWF